MLNAITKRRAARFIAKPSDSPNPLMELKLRNHSQKSAYSLLINQNITQIYDVDRSPEISEMIYFLPLLPFLSFILYHAISVLIGEHLSQRV
jgi:hypothetical protein